MKNLVIFTVLLFAVLFAGCWASVTKTRDSHACENDGEKTSELLDAFHEVLERADISGKTLPLRYFQYFIDDMFRNLQCVKNKDGSGNGCLEAMCVNASSLISHLGGDPVTSGDVTEDEFGNASLVLLYHILNLDHYCHGGINTTLTLNDAKYSLLHLMGADSDGINNGNSSSSEHSRIYEKGITAMLDSIKIPVIMKNPNHHDDNNSDDHSDNGDICASDKENKPGADEKHDDDDGDGDDDDDGYEDHCRMFLVVSKKCLSSDAILFYLGGDVEGYVNSDSVREISSIVLYHLSQGSFIRDSCRLLPRKSAFLDNLFETFTGDKHKMDLHELETLMTEMKIKPGSAETEEGDHHDHRRRRRSVNIIDEKIDGDVTLRVKRHVNVRPDLSKCYSASQLMALFGGASSSIDQETFQQLSPSLISQSLYADCGHQDEMDHHETTDWERYGYGTFATALVCITAVFGVFIMPCVSPAVYNSVMSLFMGLAVGSLFGDAVLHLIPLAMGLHSHEHGDGNDVKIEKHTQYGLALCGMVYLFYLLELFMSKYSGHSPNNDDSAPGFVTFALEETGIKQEPENGAHKEIDSETSTTTKCLQPVAVMIIVGDAFHNFADGLAIGAAFTDSVSLGIATSVAMFCHELPHELGDFAVLLKSGLSYKKAVAFNMLSAMTAFIGLYIGIPISADDSVKKWIFTCAAGMFMYISLVDVLPIVIKVRDGVGIFMSNLGLLSGFLAMFVIAVFEEHIEV